MSNRNLISLDKSIVASRSILNGERPCYNDVVVEEKPYGVGRFKFSSTAKTFISAEHIGLAQLAYEQATKSFTTTMIKDDGTFETVFEPLQEGGHISDFLQECNPDTLTWYQTAKGHPVRFSVNGNNEVERLNTGYYTKSYKAGRAENFESRGEWSYVSERTEAVAQALEIATLQYISALERSHTVDQSQIATIMHKEFAANEQNMSLLGEQAKLFDTTQNSNFIQDATQA